MVKKKGQLDFIFSHQEDNKLRLLWGNLKNIEDAELLFEIDENELMSLEKERLGFSRDELVFIGMANLSKYYWCAWQYFLKAQREEAMFFTSYFADRLAYSKELGLIKKPPKKVKDVLKIGDNIKFSDIKKLLDKRTKEYVPLDPNHKINFSLSVGDEVFEEKEIDPYKITSETSPLQKGNIYGVKKAEQYPSIRWNFRYKNIVLVGVPDGITKDFVYEFKYTGKSKYIKQTLITATCQADVYGLYFQRPKRRVQIFCEEEDKVHTYVDPINKQKVIDLLEKWIDMKEGKLPLKPQSWKCIKCEFKDDCVLLKS